jgi:hypothetical protein
VFEVLWVDGERLTHRPLFERKAILADLALDGPAWREAPGQVGGGRGLLAACEELRLEGVVAKRLDSIYRPGARTTLWRKKEVPGVARGAVAAAGAGPVPDDGVGVARRGLVGAQRRRAMPPTARSPEVRAGRPRWRSVASKDHDEVRGREFEEPKWA